MCPTIEVREETIIELDSHREEDESYDELLQELVGIYEQNGVFVQEGYSE